MLEIILLKTKSECAAKLAQLRDARLKNLRTSLKPESYWPIGWTSGIKVIKPNLRPNTQMSYERQIYQHIIQS